MTHRTLVQYADEWPYIFVVPNHCLKNNPAWDIPSGNRIALVQEIADWCIAHKFNYCAEFITITPREGKSVLSHYAADYDIASYVPDRNGNANTGTLIYFVAFASCEELSWFSLRWGYIAS